MSEDQSKKSDDDWRRALSPLAYEVTRRKGTEGAFTGEYDKHYEDGKYKCVCCGAPLFGSETKFNSGSGWPSFFAPLDEENIVIERDSSYGMVRTEVKCRQCDAHLGHVFPDGPRPTGQRYCINSVSLQFEPGGGKEK